jgi:hypothetical protein
MNKEHFVNGKETYYKKHILPQFILDLDNSKRTKTKKKPNNHAKLHNSENCKKCDNMHK